MIRGLQKGRHRRKMVKRSNRVRREVAGGKELVKSFRNGLSRALSPHSTMGYGPAS